MDRRSQRRKQRTKKRIVQQSVSWHSLQRRYEEKSQLTLKAFPIDYSLLLQFFVDWVLLPVYAFLCCIVFGFHIGFMFVFWPLAWVIHWTIDAPIGRFFTWVYRLSKPSVPEILQYPDERLQATDSHA